MFAAFKFVFLFAILYLPDMHKEEPCEWKKMRRHHPMRCSKGHCERCKTAMCAAKNCGRKAPKPKPATR